MVECYGRWGCGLKRGGVRQSHEFRVHRRASRAIVVTRTRSSGSSLTDGPEREVALTSGAMARESRERSWCGRGTKWIERRRRSSWAEDLVWAQASGFLFLFFLFILCFPFSSFPISNFQFQFKSKSLWQICLHITMFILNMVWDNLIYL
jgi:hypothetical protein